MRNDLLDRLIGDSRLAVAGLTVIALATRLLGIATRPLWYDEAFSVLFADKGLGAMLVGTLSSNGSGAAEEHPLAYYALLSTWMRAFGESLIAVRALSIVAGVVAVLVVYWIARELFDARVAGVAGTIAALSPFQIHYAQEVRMYVFLSLWLLLATYAYWRASQSSKVGWWMAFAVFAALAQYTHNLAAFYLLALALWPCLTRDWRSVKGIFLAGCAALLLYAPWLIHLPAQFAKVGHTYWIEKPGAYRFLTLLLVFVANLPLPGWWLVIGLFITLSVVFIGVWRTVQAIRHRQPRTEIALWLLYLSFFPATLLFLFSQWKPIYLERALLPSGAIFCIWLAWVLIDGRLARPGACMMVLLLAIAFGMGIYQHVSFSGFPYARFADMAESLQSRLQPGDVIVHSSKLSMLPSVYYDRVLPQTYVADPPGGSADTLAASTQMVLGLPAEPDISTAVGNSRRVWFVIYDESNQEYLQAGYSAHPQLTWLMQHYTRTEVTSWGDLRLYLFSRTP